MLEDDLELRRLVRPAPTKCPTMTALGSLGKPLRAPYHLRMFKEAYVRGVQNALIQGGHVAFPDEESAAKVADFIAGRVTFEPTGGAVARETTAKIAQALLDASSHLRGQPGFKAASFNKLASMDDLAKLAHAHALDVMQKAAEGSTIEGGDKGNQEPSSAEGKMDAAQRPPGYAVTAPGKTEVDTRPGAVGKEQEHPNKPAESPSGSNSVIDQTRTASLGALLRKVAEGSTILGGDKGNLDPSTAEGKMDAAQRPPGYAVLPSQGAPGELANLIRGPAVVGREIPHPNGPNESPSGTNSLIQHSAKAAAEDPYLALFKKTAAEVLEFLPGSITEDAKIAHVRACMGMNTEEKTHYLAGLGKEAADRTAASSRGTGSQPNNSDARHARPGAYDGRHANQAAKSAGELPPFIQDKIDAKRDGDKKDDDKKDDDDDKKDGKDDEKAAALRQQFRRITSAIQPIA